MSNTNTNLQAQTSNALHSAIMKAGGKGRPPMLEHLNLPYKFKWTKKIVPVIEHSSKTTIEGYMENYKNVSQDIRNQLDAEAEANEVNEIKAERLERITNPLTLIAQQQLVYHPQNHPNHYTQISSTRSQQAVKRNRGKAIGDLLLTISTHPLSSQEPKMVVEDDALSKEKDIDKLMALISLSLKKIYKPTNNNLRTSSNTSRENQDNTLRINKGTRECQKPKRAKDAAYHKEKMLLCKQEEAGFQLNAEHADWRDDIDDEPDDQELEAHYLYMAQIQEVTLDAADILDLSLEHPEQPESVNDTYLEEQGDTNITIDSLDMSTNREMVDQDDDDLAKERDLLASLIEKLKCKIDESKNRNKFLESSNKTLVDKLKETNQLMFKDLKKFQAELDSFVKPEFLKKSQRANPRLYDIGCYNDNLVLMLAPESDETIQVIPTTSVSRPRLKSNQLEDRVMSNNSQGKKQEVKDHPRRDNSIHYRLWVLEAHDRKSQAPKFKVAFRKSTCYILDLKGNDLLIVLIDFLKLFQRGLHAQVRTVRTDKGMEFLNKTLHAYFAQEGIEQQTSTARTPEQNGVVKRRNCTLVEAARTMLSAAKVPLFFWDEAVATTCFTQNRSLVIPRHEKTPYHIINSQKPSVKFFHIFGSLCYIVRDGENLDKMKEKGDACIFVGYSTQSRAYRVYNKRTRVIVETIHVNFDELPQMTSDHVSSDPVPECLTTALEHDNLSPGPKSQENVPQAAETVTTLNELDLLFSQMFDELLSRTTPVVSKSSAVTAADAPNHRQHHNTTSSTSTTVDADKPPLNIQTTPKSINQAPTQAPTVTSLENINQAETKKENA
ncbi:retrovirus-related pol polyprotein from transposon TNT 1-94 [Tanacetum coccineum]